MKTEMSKEVPDGMIVLWTVERPTATGVHIYDLKDSQEEAASEVERLGYPWSSVKIAVPYKTNEDGDIDVHVDDSY